MKSTNLGLVRTEEIPAEVEAAIRDLTRRVTFAHPADEGPRGISSVAVHVTTNPSYEEFGMIWNPALENGGLWIATR